MTDLASFREARATAKSKVRDALFEHLDLIDSCVSENPHGITNEELAILLRWKQFVRGTFVVLRDYKSYTVFLTTNQPYVAYAVLGLTTEIVDLIPEPLLAMVDAVLLPWKGRIVCDGLVSSYRIVMGPSYRASFRETYREATLGRGVVTSLDLPSAPLQLGSARQRQRLSALQRFLRRCPDTVEAFKERYGEPRLEMANEAAQEYGPWQLDGTPALKADCLMIYGNILRHQVLYVHAVKGRITHVSIVDPAD